MKLYMCRWDGPSSAEFLSLGDEYATTSRPATESDMTLVEMAVLLDQDAENCNAHDCCGMHVSLGKLMVAAVGVDAATKVMRSLCDVYGLHGMEDLRSRRSREEEKAKPCS